MWNTGLIVLLGAWLFVSSFVTESPLVPAAWPTDVAAGILLVVMGALATRKTRPRAAPKLAR